MAVQFEFYKNPVQGEEEGETVPATPKEVPATDGNTGEETSNENKGLYDTSKDEEAAAEVMKRNVFEENDLPKALKEIEQKTVLVRELYEERKCLANFLIEQAEKWSASDLREKAIAMIGEREYLRRKIAKGYNLWKLDKELLDEILRK